MVKKQKTQAATHEIATVAEPTGLEPASPSGVREPKTLADGFAEYTC